LEYLIPTTGKLYHHKIKLIKLSSDTKIEDIMKDIYEKHCSYLDHKKVNPQQILSKLVYEIFILVFIKLF